MLPHFKVLVNGKELSQVFYNYSEIMPYIKNENSTKKDDKIEVYRVVHEYCSHLKVQ